MAIRSRITPLFFACVVLTAVFAMVASSSIAKTIGMPGEAKYGSKEITSAQAASLNLACIQAADGSLDCFDSLAQATASPVARQEAKAVVGSRRSARIASGNSFMLITENSNFNNNAPGWVIAGYARQNWYNLENGYDNSATSVDAGNHSGYLAQFYKGQGLRQNRPIYSECTGLWACGPSNFNDITSSRYRN